ncbi:CotH kinase family protein [Larkinella sp. VNQ87]|uniref:CotH kinase family protein n=1 Tax=Larkinella sp. VNQ87 TaxID=3400921 RepID=UPI003BFCF04A
MKLIVCNQIPSFPDGQSLPTLRFDKDYTFTQAVSTFETGKAYKVKNGSNTFTLYFTHFPLIEIKTEGAQTISNTDERTKGVFTLANGSDALFSAPMGIRNRGNISRKFPKKSYNMELWKDPNGDDELETSLLNMRKDSKWYLLAMYNEPLRLNNATSHALWLNMHKLYYANQEADANSAIRTRYCDVFINNRYAGIYLFTEPMDRKQLKLKKTGDNGEIRGELYKADGWSDATLYKGLPAPPSKPTDEVWAEWEMDYPDPYWNNLYELIKFITKSPVDEFKNTVSQKLRLDNLADYFIFHNLLNATDNFGNNQFLARYKEGQPYFLIAWDLDGTFGYSTLAERSEDTRFISTNGLFERLLTLNPDGFKSKLRNRWFALRRNEFSFPMLKSKLTANYDLLTAEGAYTREATKWPGTVRTTDLSTVTTWLEARLKFLDEYFALFPETEPGFSLTSFHGEVDGSGKSLKWASYREPGIKEFDLEFSTDGSNFTKVTTLPATGDEQTGQTYTYRHEDVTALAFYRLKIVADDNGSSYSPSIQIGLNSCPDAPSAPTISTNLTDLTEGQTAVLTASGCVETVVWSTGQTGFSIQVNPAVSTLYTAKCRKAAGCESNPSAPVKVNVYPNGSLPGNFEGYLGGIDCNSLRGWVWDRNKPNSALYVELLDGEQVIATVIADDFRQDLKNAGKGNGIHGFTFSIPETLKDNQQHTLSGRVLGTNYILKDSPKKLTCQGAPQPPTNQRPVAPAVAQLTAKVNTPFSATLPAFTDPDSPALTYTLTGLPEELTFTASTRTISGTPTTTATFSLTYTASDGALAGSVTFTLTVSDQSTPPPTVTGNFEGYLDKVECGSIRGWVWDRNKPNEALTVEFFANDQSIGTTKADIFRQDIKDAGKGNGYHVYNFTTPASVKTGQTVQISAKVQNSTFVLKQAPKPLNCAPNSRLGVAVEKEADLLVTPNPTTGEFEIHFYTATHSVSELSVVDEAGRSWYRKTLEGIGAQRQKVRLLGVRGTFSVILRQEKQVRSRKILVIP